MGAKYSTVVVQWESIFSYFHSCYGSNQSLRDVNCFFYFHPLIGWNCILVEHKIVVWNHEYAEYVEYVE